MGIIHYAYALDFRCLEASATEIRNLARAGKPQFLEDAARRTIADCPSLGKDFLEAQCFDEAVWINPAADDVEKADKFSKIFIASHISGLHKLSQSSFAVLEMLLPMLGWAPEQITLLLSGRQLRYLNESVNWFGDLSHVSQHAMSPSWLPFEDVKILHKEFQELQGAFCSPSDSSLKIIRQAISKHFLKGGSDLNIAKMAFSEMEERLGMSVRGNYDLILINDITSYTKVMLDPI